MNEIIRAGLKCTENININESLTDTDQVYWKSYVTNFL